MKGAAHGKTELQVKPRSLPKGELQYKRKTGILPHMSFSCILKNAEAGIGGRVLIWEWGTFASCAPFFCPDFERAARHVMRHGSVSPIRKIPVGCTIFCLVSVYAFAACRGGKNAEFFADPVAKNAVSCMLSGR